MESTEDGEMDDTESTDGGGSATDDTEKGETADNGETTDGGSDAEKDTTGSSAPGFGASVTLAALLSAAALGRWQ